MYISNYVRAAAARSATGPDPNDLHRHVAAGRFGARLTTQQQKLSVYPEADREITLVETSTELERQVGSLRRAIQRQTGDAVHKVKSGVNSVINVENRVESALATAYTDRVNQLVAKDESLTPNGLYVGVITLASMVFTRHRT